MSLFCLRLPRGLPCTSNKMPNTHYGPQGPTWSGLLPLQIAQWAPATWASFQSLHPAPGPALPQAFVLLYSLPGMLFLAHSSGWLLIKLTLSVQMSSPQKGLSQPPIRWVPISYSQPHKPFFPLIISTWNGFVLLHYTLSCPNRI